MATIESIDYSVYLVTDTQLAADRPLGLIVAAAIRGGAKIIQYRDKGASTRKMVETARSLSSLCHDMGACFLINDRLDVALAVDADGVHIGQDDMPVGAARKLLGSGRLIGVTVHNLDELRAAEEENVNYLSVAPVFATSTKPDHQLPLGLEGLKALAAISRKPLVAIGGISHSNAAEVILSGAHGICVVSSIITAADPEKATRELYRIVKEAKAVSGVL
jgi:thiamine-phosphate pyrophosphorylase